MHNGNWNDTMDNGTWWWIPMTIMMIAFWGGLIWIGVTLLKCNHTPQLHTCATPPETPTRPTAEDVLAERLARGEIEPDDYRTRLDALRNTSRT